MINKVAEMFNRAFKVELGITERLYALLFDSNRFIQKKIEETLEMVNKRVDEMLEKVDTYFKDISERLERIEAKR